MQMEDEEAILFDSEAFERMKKEWVLRPTTQSPRRRCCGLKKRVLWTLGVVSIVILTAVLAKKLPRHEKQPQPPQEPYINALRKALMFFNAQRCKFPSSFFFFLKFNLCVFMIGKK